MAAAALIAALTACSNAGAVAGQQSGPEAAGGASASPYADPERVRKQGTLKAHSGVRPTRQRSLDSSWSIAGTAVSGSAWRFRPPLNHAAKYDDGVTVSTGGFSQGVVTEKGAGAVTGATYVRFKVRVSNGSAATLDLSAVVPTMVYGPDQVPAAPLYTGVEVADLVGKVAAGASAEGTYAFMVPEDATKTELYLDINGTHAPVSFTGDLP